MPLSLMCYVSAISQDNFTGRTIWVNCCLWVYDSAKKGKWGPWRLFWWFTKLSHVRTKHQCPEFCCYKNVCHNRFFLRIAKCVLGGRQWVAHVHLNYLGNYQKDFDAEKATHKRSFSNESIQFQSRLNQQLHIAFLHVSLHSP